MVKKSSAKKKKVDNLKGLTTLLNFFFSLVPISYSISKLSKVRTLFEIILA
jgi:hypothetical protein